MHGDPQLQTANGAYSCGRLADAGRYRARDPCLAVAVFVSPTQVTAYLSQPFVRREIPHAAFVVALVLLLS
jgi:hypothetical protein